MEREHKRPAPRPAPEAAPVPPPSPERTGLLGLLRTRAKQSRTPERPAPTPMPEAAPAAEPRVRRTMGGNVLTLLRRATAERPATPEAPQPASTQTNPEATPPVEAPEFVRAGKVRRFARAVLRQVMAEVNTEAARPRPVETKPLVAAAGELHQATTELSSAMGGYERHASPEPAHNSEHMPRRIFEDVVVERIDKRMRQLEAEAKTARRTSVLATGLGIVAVLVAGHQYLANRRTTKAHAELTTRVAVHTEAMAVQADALAAQRAELKTLREEHAKDRTRAERQDYYDKLSEFTHHQAEETREAAVQLEQATERPRLTWKREAIVAPPESPHRGAEHKPAPIRSEHVASTSERTTPAKPNAGSAGGGGGAAGGSAGRAIPPHTDEKPPLNPVALRQEAIRKARAARLASNAWVYGTVMGAVMVGAAIFFLVGW